MCQSLLLLDTFLSIYCQPASSNVFCCFRWAKNLLPSGDSFPSQPSRSWEREGPICRTRQPHHVGHQSCRYQNTNDKVAASSPWPWPCWRLRKALPLRHACMDPYPGFAAVYMPKKGCAVYPMLAQNARQAIAALATHYVTSLCCNVCPSLLLSICSCGRRYRGRLWRLQWSFFFFFFVAASYPTLVVVRCSFFRS